MMASICIDQIQYCIRPSAMLGMGQFSIAPHLTIKKKSPTNYISTGSASKVMAGAMAMFLA